jgi:hypothetical protein
MDESRSSAGDYGVGMSTRKQEILRGFREAQAGIELLRSLWPAAFPLKFRLVKPLKVGVLEEIVARTGWNRAYTSGVLKGWKLRSAYCEAVLRHDRRVSLDGKEVEEAVDEESRALARKRLAAIAARKVRQQEKLRAAAISENDGAARR